MTWIVLVLIQIFRINFIKFITTVFIGGIDQNFIIRCTRILYKVNIYYNQISLRKPLWYCNFEMPSQSMNMCIICLFLFSQNVSLYFYLTYVFKRFFLYMYCAIASIITSIFVTSLILITQGSDKSRSFMYRPRSCLILSISQ